MMSKSVFAVYIVSNVPLSVLFEVAPTAAPTPEPTAMSAAAECDIALGVVAESARARAVTVLEEDADTAAASCPSLRF